MENTIVNELLYSVWIEFLQAQPHANVYHTPEKFATLTQAKGHSLAVWAAMVAGEVMALFLPVVMTLVNGPMRQWKPCCGM